VRKSTGAPILLVLAVFEPCWFSLRVAVAPFIYTLLNRMRILDLRLPRWRRRLASDGRTVAAAQEELHPAQHDPRFLGNAVDFACRRRATRQADYIVFYESRF
jgi:hypothetical protein